MEACSSNSLFLECDEVVEWLDQCLAVVMDWMRDHKLKLSSDKTMTLLVAT